MPTCATIQTRRSGWMEMGHGRSWTKRIAGKGSEANSLIKTGETGGVSLAVLDMRGLDAGNLRLERREVRRWSRPTASMIQSRAMANVRKQAFRLIAVAALTMVA